MSRACRTLRLSQEQRAELMRVRDTHPKAYVRERAAAVLKVADGAAVCQVAAQGLLKPRREETISDWLDRYEAEGVAGFGVRAGRGRKPAYVP